MATSNKSVRDAGSSGGEQDECTHPEIAQGEANVDPAAGGTTDQASPASGDQSAKQDTVASPVAGVSKTETTGTAKAENAPQSEAKASGRPLDQQERRQAGLCGPMSQQRNDSGAQSMPQKLVQLVDCRDLKIVGQAIVEISQTGVPDPVEL
jgi:hypothetical protein